jgi:TRAP-type mannitol/chloroaromatic compound transport system substrate-binding protein
MLPLAELIEFVNKLFEVRERLELDEDKKRLDVARYLRSVAQCLQGSAEQLKENEVPHGKWSELRELADNFQTTIGEGIGQVKAEELHKLLIEIIKNTPEDKSYIKPIEEAAGKLRGLATTVAAKKDLQPPPASQFPFSFPLSRRGLIFSGLFASSALVTAGLSSAVTSESQNKSIKWKMASFLGAGTENLILYKAQKRFRERIQKMTNGKFTIELDGSIKGKTQEILRQVSDGKDIQCGYSGIYYSDNEYKFLFFGSSIPFGLTPQEQTIWLNYKQNPEDELTYVQRLYEKVNLQVIPFPVAATGGQMGGWFKKEISTVDHFKGITMRIPGLGGEVLAKLKVQLSQTIHGEIPPKDIHQALKSDKIDAAEWIGPHDDWELKLHEAKCSYYYYPGWWEPSTTFDIQVNKNAWEELPGNYKEIFKAACSATYTETLAEYEQKNSEVIKKIKEINGINILPFNDEIMQIAKDKTNELLGDYKKNPNFSATYEEWHKFREQLRQWQEYNLIKQKFLS